jgi:tetratricopeptide (TPR) repeat protein
MLMAFLLVGFAQDAGLAAFHEYASDVNQPIVEGKPRAKPETRAQRQGLQRQAESILAKANALRQKQTRQHLTEAVHLLQQSVVLFKAAHSYTSAADASLRSGEILFILSQYPEALDSYKKALMLAGADSELRCRALSHLATTYANKGDFSQAKDYSEQALKLSEGLSAEARAEALEAGGEAIQYQRTEAAEYFTKARILFAEAQNTDGEAQALLMLAFAIFSGDHAEALLDANRAMELWSGSGNLHGVAKAYSALGAFAAATDRFETAQCNHEIALKQFQKIGDEDNEAVALSWIGNTSRARGDLETALKNFEVAVEVSSKLQDHVAEIEAVGGLAKVLAAMGKYDRALPLYLRKARLAEKTDNPAQRASAHLDIGSLYELQHDYVQAERFYRRALEEYGRLKDSYGVGDALIRLSVLQAAQGRYEQAISSLESALGSKDESKQPQDIARIYYELASIFHRLGRLEEALAAIEKTIRIVEDQELRIKAFNSRAAYFASIHKYYALNIQLLMLLDHQSPDKGFRQLAFEISDKSKARSLQDLLEVSAQGLSCNDLLTKQRADPVKLASTTPSSKTPPGRKLNEIQSEIGPDDAILEFSLGEEKSFLWVVDRKRMDVHELPPASNIRKLVAAFNNALTVRLQPPGESVKVYQEKIKAADKRCVELARRLGDMLLGQADIGHAKRLLIVPDGVLQYIPFSALRLYSERKSEIYLLDKYEFMLLPSLSALATLRAIDRPIPKSKGTILAYLPVTPGAHAECELPHSAEEAQAIKKILALPPDSVKYNTNWTSDVQAQVQGSQYVHFAVHGKINPLRPEMSYLILSSLNGCGAKGALKLGRIYDLHLSAGLVVLSACDSALGKNMESEGSIGLPRAFLYAGAKSVVASLWKVDDKTTKELMVRLYAGLQQDKRPSLALHDAQREIKKTWSAPFFWASFALQGDYQ